MNSKQYRMNEFISATDGRSLVVDTSSGLALGVQAGLEDMGTAVTSLLPHCDGLVVSPGQVRAIVRKGRQDAALLVRADWTNALRGPDFVLPAETIHYVPLLQPANAVELGVNALVTYFLLGHDEQIETACMKNSVQMALQGNESGMPLIVDIQPAGPRVVLRYKAIELGFSFALESGADGIAVPWPGAASFKTIMKMAGDVPVWIKPASLQLNAPELAQALEFGAAGFWLDERVFLEADPAAVVEALAALVHQPETAVALESAL